MPVTSSSHNFTVPASTSRWRVRKAAGPPGPPSSGAGTGRPHWSNWSDRTNGTRRDQLGKMARVGPAGADSTVQGPPGAEQARRDRSWPDRD